MGNVNSVRVLVGGVNSFREFQCGDVNSFRVCNKFDCLEFEWMSPNQVNNYCFRDITVAVIKKIGNYTFFCGYLY